MDGMDTLLLASQTLASEEADKNERQWRERQEAGGRSRRERKVNTRYSNDRFVSEKGRTRVLATSPKTFDDGLLGASASAQASGADKHKVARLFFVL